MSSTVIKDFFKNYPEISYKKGEKILRPNEFSDHIYLIEKGFIRLYKMLKTGQEITYVSYNPKVQDVILFGTTSRLKNYHVEAFTDITVRRASKADFEKYCENHPEVKEYLLEIMQIIFDELILEIEWLSIPDAYTRMKVFLHYLATRAGITVNKKVMIDNKANLSMKFTHQLLASFTGLSRETVTLQLNRLIEEGYISRQDGTLVIEKLDELRKDIE